MYHNSTLRSPKDRKMGLQYSGRKINIVHAGAVICIHRRRRHAHSSRSTVCLFSPVADELEFGRAKAIAQRIAALDRQLE